MVGARQMDVQGIAQRVVGTLDEMIERPRDATSPAACG
jgi:hypothetical protein